MKKNVLDYRTPQSSSGGVYVKGTKVIAEFGAVLPKRCARCGGSSFLTNVIWPENAHRSKRSIEFYLCDRHVIRSSILRYLGVMGLGACLIWCVIGVISFGIGVNDRYMIMFVCCMFAGFAYVATEVITAWTSVKIRGHRNGFEFFYTSKRFRQLISSSEKRE